MTYKQSEAGLLVISDANYPGWHATLDGSPVPVLTGDAVFRAVWIPAGAHHIHMQFEPAALPWALLLAALAIAVTIGLVTIDIKRRSNRVGKEQSHESTH